MIARSKVYSSSLTRNKTPTFNLTPEVGNRDVTFGFCPRLVMSCLVLSILGALSGSPRALSDFPKARLHVSGPTKHRPHGISNTPHILQKLPLPEPRRRYKCRTRGAHASKGEIMYRRKRLIVSIQSTPRRGPSGTSALPSKTHNCRISSSFLRDPASCTLGCMNADRVSRRSRVATIGIFWRLVRLQFGKFDVALG